MIDHAQVRTVRTSWEWQSLISRALGAARLHTLHVTIMPGKIPDVPLAHENLAIVTIRIFPSALHPAHFPRPLPRVKNSYGPRDYMEGMVTSVARSAPDGVWVPGGGIEIPCEYVLYGMKKDR